MWDQAADTENLRRIIKDVLAGWSWWDDQTWGDAQPNLLAITQNMLLKRGYHAPALHRAGSRLQARLQEALEDHGDSMRERAPLVLSARLLGIVSQTEVCERLEPLLVPARDFLFLSDHEVHEQCDFWSAVTQLGSEPVPQALGSIAAELGEVLSAVMLVACRQYRLDAASRLLRVMAYLRHDQLMIAEGAEFIAFQQRLEGSFGFLNPLAPGYDRLPSDRDIWVHLPFTVAALWGLTEVESSLKPIEIR
jgi:hypothetical protein